ncbi:hypothetical protein MLD38_040010 [Melastoma candidum]|uniref:Uncharacterized protein n=1 Tax=Melastoma candidum TaxID=119954 RepID=A0ACB9L5D6_9MYRT|nr:hypothetical protein MLD38_040010 [Melastoma candidum]
MLSFLKSRLRRLPRPCRRQSKLTIVIKPCVPFPPSPHPSSLCLSREENRDHLIRIMTFNAAFFLMAPPTVGPPDRPISLGIGEPIRLHNSRLNSRKDRPKSILKNPPLHRSPVNRENGGTAAEQQGLAKAKPRVTINLPDNEISLLRERQISCDAPERQTAAASTCHRSKGKLPIRYGASFCGSGTGINGIGNGCLYAHKEVSNRGGRTIAEVLREVDADIMALQDVKAEEERGMSSLSDLAKALGMNYYVFAETWAPEYGNAVLSRWPIRQWKVDKIFDVSDFRNVLKATIDVPEIGEVNIHCTLLDHLDENWRMKQIDAVLRLNDKVPHILTGSLNSLDESDYSQQRWTDIVKYHEELGKPTPKTEVLRFLKSRGYTDAKDFSGECEPVVVIAKGQSVQGTCKYGTRVDYMLMSPDSPYKFVPG